MMKEQMLIRIRTYIKQNHMLCPGDKVITGISGGPDSVCLFFVLLELQKELDFSIYGVHVNHGLRGAPADQDEVFVKKLCEAYQIPLEVVKVDLKEIAKKRKQSLEEAGREVRREAFLRVMKEQHGTKIAMAHHQNDNAETLLWNLARGTGLHGLGGIRPVHAMWIRPLLCMNRQEIMEMLEEMNQEFCTDLTNLETLYTRNKIRHRVIPYLEKEINPAAVRHMNETMEQMGDLRDFVEEETEKAFQKCVYFPEEEENLVIQEEEWRKLPHFLQNEVLYVCIERICGSRKDVGRTHVETLRGLFDLQVGRSRNLPGNVLGIRSYEGIQLKKEGRKVCVEKELFSPRELLIPGVTEIPEKNLRITCEILEWKEGGNLAEIPQKRYTKWFDYDIITSCLKLRGRKTGDWIAIDRQGHQQKLKSWFVNAKVPADQRDQIPLIADGTQILWIVGYRMNMAYQVSEQTKRVLKITIGNMLEDEKDGRED